MPYWDRVFCACYGINNLLDQPLVGLAAFLDLGMQIEYTFFLDPYHDVTKITGRLFTFFATSTVLKIELLLIIIVVVFINYYY